MRIAFVSPRMGEDIVGGAEFVCMEVASRLKEAGINVEILSTTIGDYHKLEDVFPPGCSLLNGVPLLRFSPDQANMRVYLKHSAALAESGQLGPRKEQEWEENGLNSSGLMKYLEDHLEQYDRVVFFQYLRALSHRGVELCKEKAIMCPTLHDEPFARLAIVKRMMNECSGLVFLSEPEKRLAIRLYGLNGVPRAVTGLGFVPQPPVTAAFARCSSPYILYTGRIEAAKGVHFLIDSFLHYKSKRSVDLKLVLCGDVQLSCPKDSAILVAGRLSRDELQRAYASALATIQPSQVESFSISIFESWQNGRPVLVSRNCDVTREFCVRSNGGLYFGDYLEFEACLDFLLENPELASRLGAQGREFVEGEYSWNKIGHAWLDFLTSVGFPKQTRSKRLVLCNTNWMQNDAVGNNIVHKARVACDSGFDTHLLFEENAAPPVDLQGRTRLISNLREEEFHACLFSGDFYWIDYAVDYPLLRFVPDLKARGKKLLFDYHGITPPALWGDKENLSALTRGIENIKLLKYGDRIVCHSQYMKSELESYGIAAEKVEVLPYAVPVEDFFPTEKDPRLMETYELEESTILLLYVGRMAGNKRIDTLAKALGIASKSRADIRLMLVGDYGYPPYKRQVEKAKSIAAQYGVTHRMIWTGIVSHQELRRYFNLADLYVTSSLHEGFCIPVVEAMACGKPVVATRSTALPETVGDAGLLFEAEDADELAHRILELIVNKEKYDKLAEAGIRRARLFDLAHYRVNIRSFLERSLT